SVCAMLEAILLAQGYSTGFYSSPHLVSMNERIRVNGKPVSKPLFAQTVSALKPLIRKTNASYFEALTLTAAEIFRQKKPEFIILETGLGGRLDATNAFDTDVQVITSISLEHTQYLGNTIQKIAREKAGIIKRNETAVVSRTNAGYSAIKEKIKQMNATDINPRTKFRKMDFGGTEFESIHPRAIPHLTTNLIGIHQAENAGLALGAVYALQKKGIRITSTAIRKGLMRVNWPARMQVLQTKPNFILLDGAHNPDGVRTLLKSVRKLPFNRLIGVFGCLRTKNYAEMIREIHAEELILTHFKHPQALSIKILQRIAEKNKKIRHIQSAANPRQAIALAQKTAGPKDLILVFGSLYLAGEVLKNESKKNSA
ncbi:MAG: bifunctional folylpolyglutamate synthase/dihydrofolate synthase, partial [Candidatus Diapherotrites archaeon]|nr:bifunctional folylpolyglutamate synthase/dihydrofolate synthase [Candidatus Diapherotrites archaeon]